MADNRPMPYTRVNLLPHVEGCFRHSIRQDRVLVRESKLYRRILGDISMLNVYLRRMNPHQPNYTVIFNQIDTYLSYLERIKQIFDEKIPEGEDILDYTSIII